METSGFSTASHISDERIVEMEAKGEQARKECRSRIPAAATFSAIETKAFQRGWDREDKARRRW